MRINGHKQIPAAPKPGHEPVLCIETQARAITAAIVAEAIEEALGQRAAAATPSKGQAR